MLADISLWLRLSTGSLMMIGGTIIFIVSFVLLVKILKFNAWGDHPTGHKEEKDSTRQPVAYEEPTEYFGNTGFDDAFFIDEPEEKEQEELHETLSVDATPLIVEYWDQHLNRIAANQVAKLFFEARDSKNPTGNLLDMALGQLNTQMWESHLNKTFETGFAIFEYEYIQAGKRYHFEVVSRRRTYKEGTIAVTYSRDVGPEKEVAKERERKAIAEARTEAKTRFLAQMSHEIRTPISAVLGISEVELRKANHLSPEVEEAFRKIHETSRILVGIVNDILDISKIEAGKMSIDPRPYNVGEMLQSVTSMHTVFLETKKFRFKVKVARNLHSQLYGDELRLKQVINNILSNSFKYTEKGQVSFTIKAVPAGPKMVNLVIEIKDTGYGMTPEQVNALLTEDYVRFIDKEKPYIQGTGLGISITQNLLFLMNGRMDVESTAGIGTKITLTIPQEVIAEETIGEEAALALEQLTTLKFVNKIDVVNLSHGKVLVVDDIETNLYVARGLLDFYQLSVETATSGAEAIEKVKAGNQYDIIFMDQMMPEMDGTTATQLLRQMDYHKPIVALTADAATGQADKFIQSGFNDFLAKPIETQLLHQILLKYM